MSDALNIELLNIIANALIKNSRAFVGSKWGKCEAEVIAAQAIVSARHHFNTDGDAFTWAGTSLRNRSPMANNAEGLRRLIVDGSVFRESYYGDLTPPVTVIYEDEKPQVLRVTNALLEYAAVHLKIGDTVS